MRVQFAKGLSKLCSQRQLRKLLSLRCVAAADAMRDYDAQLQIVPRAHDKNENISCSRTQPKSLAKTMHKTSNERHRQQCSRLNGRNRRRRPTLLLLPLQTLFAGLRMFVCLPVPLACVVRSATRKQVELLPAHKATAPPTFDNNISLPCRANRFDCRQIKSTYRFVGRKLLAEAKVGQDDVAERVEQNVLEFDVAIDDSELSSLRNRKRRQK